jgi:hypothetical protein
VTPRLIHRFIVGLVGAGALALLLTSFALAGARPDNRSGPLGAVPAAVVVSASDDVFMRAYTRYSPVSDQRPRPDDRSGPRGAGPTKSGGSASATHVRPDDRSGSRGATKKIAH